MSRTFVLPSNSSLAIWCRFASISIVRYRALLDPKGDWSASRPLFRLPTPHPFCAGQRSRQSGRPDSNRSESSVRIATRGEALPRQDVWIETLRFDEVGSSEQTIRGIRFQDSPDIPSERSTYLASTSVSRFTASPTFLSPRVVTSSVWGINATEKES